MQPAARSSQFVSRGGLKLRHALDTFTLNPSGLICADLGCSTGGFTDCLLQAGAARVHAVDTGYGVLAWKLRQDQRVITHERQNALHFPPPEPVNLVVIDIGWTPQKHCVPAALKWLHSPSLREGAGGRAEYRDPRLPAIITLIKPHYENKPLADQHRGVLPDDLADQVAQQVLADMPALGVQVIASTPSPVRGSAGKSQGQGNREWLALLVPTGSSGSAP